MVHVEKNNNNLKRHAFRSPRRLKTMATGTHGAEAPSDSEAPPQLEDTVSLCDHPLHPSAHTWLGTEVPSVAQTLLLPRIFSQYLWVWLICPVQALEGTLLPRNILNLIFLCMEWNSLCSPLEAVFHLVPPGVTVRRAVRPFGNRLCHFPHFRA